MPLLWRDLKNNLAPSIGDGSCDPVYQARVLNSAIERLMQSKQWKSLTSIMRMAIIDDVFPMPYNVEALLGVAIDGRPSQIFGTEYQVVTGGPGDLDAWATTYTLGKTNGLTDMGEHATMFDVPLDREGYVIVAFCTAQADVGKVIRLKGHGYRNEEVTEELSLVRWDRGIEGEVALGSWGSASTKNQFRSVTRVILPSPSTTGYVSLYAVYPSENQMYFLGKYHPSMRIPTFRRYRFTTSLADTGPTATSPGLDSASNCATVLAQVKLKFVPYVDDYDVVPFDSEQAVENMLRAMNIEKTNPAAGAQFEALALKLLGNAQASKDVGRTMPVIIGSNPVTGLGQFMNRNAWTGRL